MNVTQDTIKHIAAVRTLLCVCAGWLNGRGERHDKSKLASPEKETFEEWRPKLSSMLVDSPEYANALAKMGTGLRHHYENNSHHPEHYKNGIAGMDLLDLVEMVCDWMVAAENQGKPIDPGWAQKRFGIEPQLLAIIMNTVDALNLNR